jgi:hypothetical protein
VIAHDTAPPPGKKIRRSDLIDEKQEEALGRIPAPIPHEHGHVLLSFLAMSRFVTEVLLAFRTRRTSLLAQPPLPCELFTYPYFCTGLPPYYFTRDDICHLVADIHTTPPRGVLLGALTALREGIYLRFVS